MNLSLLQTVTVQTMGLRHRYFAGVGPVLRYRNPVISGKVKAPWSFPQKYKEPVFFLGKQTGEMIVKIFPSFCKHIAPSLLIFSEFSYWLLIVAELF